MPHQFEGLTIFELSRRVQRREFLVRNWVSGDYRDVLVWNRLRLANRCKDTKGVKVEREHLEGLSYQGLYRGVYHLPYGDVRKTKVTDVDDWGFPHEYTFLRSAGSAPRVSPL